MLAIHCKRIPDAKPCLEGALAIFLYSNSELRTLERIVISEQILSIATKELSDPNF